MTEPIHVVVEKKKSRTSGCNGCLIWILVLAALGAAVKFWYVTVGVLALLAAFVIFLKIRQHTHPEEFIQNPKQPPPDAGSPPASPTGWV